jgi:hypothetical protein
MKALKTSRFVPIWLVLTTLLLPIFIEPCSAAFLPGNNITLESDGMTWRYTEHITDSNATLFRNFIDFQEGDSNNFVNAWEILKAEIFMRDKMKESIEKEPDVKLNGTPEYVKTTDIDFIIPEEALGKTEKNSSITSSASVSYIFEKNVSSDTDIWFMGTPNSSVTIMLPVGFDATKTEGLDNRSSAFENNRTVFRGNFSSEKNITIWISENRSFKAELQNAEGKEENNFADADGNTSTDHKANKNTGAKDSTKLLESFDFLEKIFARLG